MQNLPDLRFAVRHAAQMVDFKRTDYSLGPNRQIESFRISHLSCFWLIAQYIMLYKDQSIFLVYRKNIVEIYIYAAKPACMQAHAYASSFR